MSGDLTARDVIARKLACQYNGEPGDDSGWEYHVDHALELMDTLAAAGWRLDRDRALDGEPIDVPPGVMSKASAFIERARRDLARSRALDRELGLKREKG